LIFGVLLDVEAETQRATVEECANRIERFHYDPRNYRSILEGEWEEPEMTPAELERAKYIYTHGGIWPRQPDEERARDVSLVAPIILRLREGWEAKTEAKIRKAIEQRDRAEALLLETKCGTPQIMLVPVGWVERVTALLKERGLL
jgi:hypothetical protein